jgi:hypothetical protein
MPRTERATKLRRSERTGQSCTLRHEERYYRPVTHYVLQGLVQCGICGSRNYAASKAMLLDLCHTIHDHLKLGGVFVGINASGSSLLAALERRMVGLGGRYLGNFWLS